MSVVPISEAPLSQVEDWRQIAAWNATEHAYPRELCVQEMVAQVAAATPAALAVSAPDAVLTYGQLDQRANQLALRLRDAGAGPDVPVGLCLPRSAALVIGALGILRAGSAYVPLDPSYPKDRQRFMLEDSGSPLVVTDSVHAERLRPGPCTAITLDGEVTIPPAEVRDSPPSTVLPRNLAYLIYTSGSTGRPKGVEITHESLLNLVFWHQRAFEVSSADRATQLASPSFDAAVWEIWPYLAVGASLHIPDEATRTSTTGLRDWLLTQGITITFQPTPLAESLLMLDWPGRASLRVLLTGGDVLHRYPPAGLPFALINNYGPTESTVVATSCVVSPSDDYGPLPSIGRPIANTRLHVLDESLKPVQIGQVGELCISGDGLARGYRNRPELTAEKFVETDIGDEEMTRVYRTGDLARWGCDGEVEFVGRLDEQVKIRGFRIELHEVASMLNAHESVRACEVVARDDGQGGRRLVAYVVLGSGEELDIEALRSHLSERLPDYMVPATYVRLEGLPLTPNGKVDREALPEPDDQNMGRWGDLAAPRTLLEEELVSIVSELLQLEQVGIDENFFVLGGHSLLGAQLIARLRTRFGVELELRTLFDNPTIERMAAAIEAKLIQQLESLSDDEAERELMALQADGLAG
jgi:amino acid adenylation domain-containing protein